MKSHRSLPLLTGRKPILEAMEQGTAIEKIFLLRSATGSDIARLKTLAKELNIPVSAVPAEKLDGMTKTQHQGIVAWISLLQYIDLQAALSHVVESGANPLFVLADGITDVRNIGAIARSALCCGAQALVLPLSHIASLTDEAVKSSAGAVHKMMLCRTPSVQQAMDIFKLNGIQIVGTHLKGSVPVFEADFTVPTVIIMGAEDTGISKEVIKRADRLVKIPMATGFDSFNVSVATGIILYEAMKQRMLGTK
jgi:23S rRNA (guanosine2251-2'-O)-methyltransferase